MKIGIGPSALVVVLVVIVALGASSCKQNEVEMVSSFYAMETASLARDGSWSYSAGEKFYDNDRKCLVDRSIVAEPRASVKSSPPPSGVAIWKVYVGPQKQGISYGYLLKSPEKEIAYSDGKWFSVPVGTLASLKEIFEKNCLVERAE